MQPVKTSTCEQQKKPRVSPAARLFKGAVVAGDVQLGSGSSLCYNAVVRADTDSIRIGKRTNIQDAAVVHCDFGHPVSIGDDVTVGHGCILHGCTLGDATLVGMGSILMNDVRVGSGCIIGAGSLLTSGTEIPDGMLALGRPAKVVRALTEEEKEHILEAAEEYLELMRDAAQNPASQLFGE